MKTYLIKSLLYNEWYFMHVINGEVHLTRIRMANVEMSTWHQVHVNVVNSILANAGYSSAEVAYE